MNEIFKLHEVKFSRTKNKISWGNFVAKTFSLLGNSKWYALATTHQHLRQVYKHRLSELSSQISYRRRILCGTQKRFEKKIKILYIASNIYFVTVNTLP